MDSLIASGAMKARGAEGQHGHHRAWTEAEPSTPARDGVPGQPGSLPPAGDPVSTSSPTGTLQMKAGSGSPMRAQKPR